MPSKSLESQLCEFRDKKPCGCAPMESCKVYYKGEGGEFPQVMAVVSLVCLSCPWLILPPKVLQLCTNHFGLVLCKSVWVIEACHFFLVPSWSSNMPLYPSIMPRAREGPLFFALSLFFVRIPIPNIGVHLGVWGFIPSHFLHSQENVKWLSSLPLGP